MEEKQVAARDEPELLEEDYFTIKLQETGSMPCKLHGMDHLSRDPECEFCKRALGPMYRPLNHKYGMQIADHTPTLSFDFSGPLPIAVTGAKILMVFVWRLQDIRLLWAFALVHRTKENVLSCLQSVIADLNTLTGGSKPPVTRVHSDEAKEFLSRPVMEWLKEKGIRQTFTSTYDSQANGVAERWINLIKQSQQLRWHHDISQHHFGVMQWHGSLAVITTKFLDRNLARISLNLDNCSWSGLIARINFKKEEP